MRSIITIDDLSDDELEQVFSLADGFLERMGDPARPYRIRGRATLAADYILATLFFEPSTRTRFSFESAMARLGGAVISSPNSAVTSAAKGESIADTVRVVENYADVIVMRHPSEGAARVAADYACVPVINAGDGSHEHPTQTLCDLYTLRRERAMTSLKDFAGLNVALCGDLKHGRTVHSLVYALARLRACIIPMAASGLGLPEHVAHRLQRDYQCVATTLPSPRTPVPEGEGQRGPTGDVPVDMIYVTPHGPHQQTIYGYVEAPPELKNVLSEIHVFYVTRLQTERGGASAGAQAYQKIDKKMLKRKGYKDSRVMHPLPRVGELDYDLDQDPRGVYFKQAAYGVSVRMALLTWLLDLNKTGAAPQATEAKFPDYAHEAGLRCDNPACVTRLASEQQYLKSAFWIVEQKDAVVVRCKYCDFEYRPECVGRVSKREYGTDPALLKSIAPRDRILFANPQDAAAAGYALREEPVVHVG